eukprot:12923530-Alexandrium_andersonii.AAC.1
MVCILRSPAWASCSGQMSQAPSALLLRACHSDVSLDVMHACSPSVSLLGLVDGSNVRQEAFFARHAFK